MTTITSLLDPIDTGEIWTPTTRLRVSHATRFRYEGMIINSYNDARLCPITDPQQRCVSFQLDITPWVMLHTYHDFYHNRVDHFELHEIHDSLDVVSTSIIETRPDPRGAVPYAFALSSLDDPSLSENYFDFLPSSPFVSLEAEVWREGIDILPYGVQDLWQDSVLIGSRIHRTFRYQPYATNVHTRMIEALRERRGVCQDFAHVMIAICRTQGIPARYVSGYFHNSNRREGEIEASHAWVEVYLPYYGWKGYDPTHEREIDERYVKLAVGRDYSDIRPLAGTFRGRGTKSMVVEVTVDRI